MQLNQKQLTTLKKVLNSNYKTCIVNPVESQVHLSIENKTFTVSVFNFNHPTRYHIPVDTDEQLNVVTDLKALKQIISQLAHDTHDTTINVKDESLFIGNNKMRFTLPLLKNAVPVFPTAKQLITDEDKIADVVTHILQASYFTNTSTETDMCSNIHVFNRNQSLIIESTDRHQLYQYQTLPHYKECDFNVLINNDCKNVLTAFKYTKLGYKDDSLYLGTDDVDVMLIGSDGTHYPDLTKILFADGKIKATIANNDLQTLIKTFSISDVLDTRLTNAAIIQFNDFLPSRFTTLQIESPDKKISTKIGVTDVINNSDGDDTSIAFNPNLLKSATKLNVDEWRLVFANNLAFHAFMLVNEKARIDIVVTPLRIS